MDIHSTGQVPTFLPVSAEFEIPLANFYLQFSVIANLMQIITQNMIKKIHVAMQSKLTLKICLRHRPIMDLHIET